MINSLSNSVRKMSMFLTETNWKGCRMEEIYRGLGPFELEHFPAVEPSDSHTVLYEFPIKDISKPPIPIKGNHKWDNSHVKLSFYPESKIYEIENDQTVEKSRWEFIKEALETPIQSSEDFEAIILFYNPQLQNYSFSGIHAYFETYSDEKEEFFKDLLPKIIKLALRMPELIQAPIPLLKESNQHSISLSQEQISCLLANAFLCTFPETLEHYPDINFTRLFGSPGYEVVVEKLRCILHYFRSVCDNPPLGVLTFERRYIPTSELPNWDQCDLLLGDTLLRMTSEGTIEDQGTGLLQVDFADKYLGGIVLGVPCAQEEVRFLINPELIVGKLFTERLLPNEAVVMIGAERFNYYKGYEDTFTWNGDYKDETPFDSSRRRKCNILAIDALEFAQDYNQFEEKYILRDLNKAYVGFIHSLETPAPGIASGNWGCGEFGGELTLKALIQLMACTMAKRPLVYFSFGDNKLCEQVCSIHSFFAENKVTVKKLWSILKTFQDSNQPTYKLYGFIRENVLKN